MNENRGRTLVIASIVLAFIVSYIAVAQHVRCVDLGYQVDRAERRRDELLRLRALMLGRLARERAPAQLVARGRAFGLELDYPAPDARPRGVDGSWTSPRGPVADRTGEPR